MVDEVVQSVHHPGRDIVEADGVVATAGRAVQRTGLEPEAGRYLFIVNFSLKFSYHPGLSNRPLTYLSGVEGKNLSRPFSSVALPAVTFR